MTAGHRARQTKSGGSSSIGANRAPYGVRQGKRRERPTVAANQAVPIRGIGQHDFYAAPINVRGFARIGGGFFTSTTPPVSVHLTTIGYRNAMAMRAIPVTRM